MMKRKQFPSIFFAADGVLFMLYIYLLGLELKALRFQRLNAVNMVEIDEIYNKFPPLPW